MWFCYNSAMLELGGKVEFTHFNARKTEGVIVERNRLSYGGEACLMGAYEKGLAKIEIGKGGRKRIWPLFYKSTDSSDDYVEMYHRLKKAGLPVPPTIRKIDDEFIAVTDYNALGAVFFGKAMVSTMREYNRFPEARRLIDGIPTGVLLGFVDACRHKEDIRRLMEEYERRVNSNHIHLPVDEQYEIVVFPDGKWKLMFFDLHCVFVDHDETRLKKANKHIIDITDHSIDYMYKWLCKRRLPNLQEELLLQGI